MSDFLSLGMVLPANNMGGPQKISAIAALDLIRDEFLRPGSAWVKWCWTALGLVFMSLLALWI